jgi:Fur family ferric uptake transcriptional regulator
MARQKQIRRKEEFEVFERYIVEKRLKHSRQREIILERFLETDGHLSVDELYQIIQRRHPEIGRTTIYRTLKLLCDAKLAKSIEFRDGRTRFEHIYKQGHHDHMICTRCKTVIEFCNEEIQRLQEKLAKKHGFTVDSHRHQIFGVCSKCRRKETTSKKTSSSPKNSRHPQHTSDSKASLST